MQAGSTVVSDNYDSYNDHPRGAEVIDSHCGAGAKLERLCHRGKSLLAADGCVASKEVAERDSTTIYRCQEAPAESCHAPGRG